uniref:E3 ubiquitin-protein ligase RNF103 isoform X2 n=1 Tax=Ciona intestinalis TaxID=7719 RepID=UPI00052122C4|nr:E3 ubiquitin-protein ligase RNF103 isoform X2 [Ciona intestinalis]|eukprot:XP_009862187.1 E3 ubiquitin-protein ligase RNF103 isoform X2 [Ciona intestinalis]
MFLLKISVVLVYLILVFSVYHLINIFTLNNSEIVGLINAVSSSLKQIRSLIADGKLSANTNGLANLDMKIESLASKKTSKQTVTGDCYSFNKNDQQDLFDAIQTSDDVLLIQEGVDLSTPELLFSCHQLQGHHNCVYRWSRCDIEIDWKSKLRRNKSPTYFPFMMKQGPCFNKQTVSCAVGKINKNKDFCLKRRVSCSLASLGNVQDGIGRKLAIILPSSFKFSDHKGKNENSKAINLDVNLLFNWSVYICSFLGCLSFFTTQSSFLSRVIAAFQSLITYNFFVLGTWLLQSGYKINCIQFVANSMLFQLRKLLTKDVIAHLHENWMVLVFGFFVFFTLVVDVLKRANILGREQEIETTLSEILLNNNRWHSNDGDISQRWVQRLATPSLWLQPLVPMDYISELPVWRYTGRCVASSDDSDADHCSKEFPRSSKSWYQRQLRSATCSKQGSSCIARSVIRSIRSCLRSRSPAMRRINNAPDGMREETSCSICLDNYKQHDHVCGLPCGHVFHHSCILSWLHSDQHCCPICRWPAYQVKSPEQPI